MLYNNARMMPAIIYNVYAIAFNGTMTLVSQTRFLDMSNVILNGCSVHAVWYSASIVQILGHRMGIPYAIATRAPGLSERAARTLHCAGFGPFIFIQCIFTKCIKVNIHNLAWLKHNASIAPRFTWMHGMCRPNSCKANVISYYRLFLRFAL